MFDFADKALVLLTILGSAGILGILHVAACCASHEMQAHDLRVRVQQLRQEKIAKLRQNAVHPAGIVKEQKAPDQQAA